MGGAATRASCESVCGPCCRTEVAGRALERARNGGWVAGAHPPLCGHGCPAPLLCPRPRTRPPNPPSPLPPRPTHIASPKHPPALRPPCPAPPSSPPLLPSAPPPLGCSGRMMAVTCIISSLAAAAPSRPAWAASPRRRICARRCPRFAPSPPGPHVTVPPAPRCSRLPPPAPPPPAQPSSPATLSHTHRLAHPRSAPTPPSAPPLRRWRCAKIFRRQENHNKTLSVCSPPLLLPPAPPPCWLLLRPHDGRHLFSNQRQLSGAILASLGSLTTMQ